MKPLPIYKSCRKDNRSDNPVNEHSNPNSHKPEMKYPYEENAERHAASPHDADRNDH